MWGGLLGKWCCPAGAGREISLNGLKPLHVFLGETIVRTLS